MISDNICWSAKKRIQTLDDDEATREDKKFAQLTAERNNKIEEFTATGSYYHLTLMFFLSSPHHLISQLLLLMLLMLCVSNASLAHSLDLIDRKYSFQLITSIHMASCPTPGMRTEDEDGDARPRASACVCVSFHLVGNRHRTHAASYAHNSGSSLQSSGPGASEPFMMNYSRLAGVSLAPPGVQRR